MFSLKSKKNARFNLERNCWKVENVKCQNDYLIRISKFSLSGGYQTKPNKRTRESGGTEERDQGFIAKIQEPQRSVKRVRNEQT
jgi:hypothetical protein